MNKVYLQLEFSTGKIFEYSKEAKEGYEEYTSTKGKVSYRKYHRGVTGELDSVSIRDTQFGQEISVSLKQEGTVVYLTFGLMDQKGFVDKKDATGKNKPSAASKEVRSDFFLEKLAEQTERLKWTPSGNDSYGSNTVNTTAVQAARPVEPVQVMVDDDSLPF